jgi:hypothetical protein
VNSVPHIKQPPTQFVADPEWIKLCPSSLLPTAAELQHIQGWKFGMGDEAGWK